MKPVRILIMAKEPRPGRAKTRLIPALGEQHAAALADRLFQRTLQQALAADLGPVELHITPDPSARYWQELPGAERCERFSQVEGDLGARMAAAARNGLAQSTAVLIIGTDCPDLDADQLKALAQSLQSYDCCLCPVTDGGYALIGLRQFSHTLFTDIPWSTADVAPITRNRARALGWTCYESKYLQDVDEPEDLLHLSQNHPELISPSD
ncbi:TIGR04282 family arsenosugar biosynthesis glycosyltransferase [Marinobacter sp. MDS2]|uniref:TIGR04282 family arsenosugar biosynthesis glycosyltransferase n=1 Tax=Marinobacter sp. MDS2 TaxID=3065961 RepID=UPI00273AD6A1|nr:TIGR04282 family arsenosugar biosynthesis glycosyltransferase [Marinobacter sp. MDS2]MDP4548606.1 TIGR04282 family arsenosugar biosynthesis glycosyltransferase [Marinobacter sp. MDS2]